MNKGLIRIVEADYSNEDHRRTIPFLLNEYTKDLLGYHKELPKQVQQDIVPSLENFPTSLVVLAQHEKQYVGMAICFFGFSTFKVQWLINIHDFTVLKQYRSKGVGKAIIKKIEEIAGEKECCKITLEVQERNTSARKLYQSMGFNDQFLEKEAGNQLFLTKFIQ